jgi:glycosyltransferase involved in cell wall biosynthesis
MLSVIIPVFNGAGFITDALASVCGQSYSAMEVIVVDDGSTDGSATLIEEFRQARWPGLKYLSQPHAGPAAARNRGLDATRGEIIAFLDADDLWTEAMLPDSIELLMNEGFQIVVGCIQRVRACRDGQGDFDLRPFGPVWMAFGLIAAVFRREVFFDLVGKFDETLRFGEDVDWFLRAREAGINIGVRSEVTSLRRKHESNMTRDVEQANHYFLAALQKSLGRRRDGHGKARNLADVPALSGRKLADFQIPARNGMPRVGRKGSKRDG